MQPDAEIAAVITNMYAMFETGDASAVGGLLSGEPGVLGIGTDPHEWWAGEMLRRAFNAQLPEMHAAGMRFQAGSLQAYSEGSVGWVADQPTLTLPNGTSLPMRLTSVFHRESAGWRMVQFHLSVGVPNEAALGTLLTT